ncbi:MAG: DEAD/DEAH box helicase, partial [Pseudobdellovibrionaceae bacterium]
ALVNEKFRDLCAAFGPDQVGMVTGDGSVNPTAPIVCCTAEILSNMALRQGEFADVDDVVMDEFHYYSDKQRGVAWQIPLLSLKRTRFLLMSATLGEMDFFSKKLTELNSLDTILVQSDDRPVPLDFQYCETLLQETVSNLVTTGKAPVYLVNFSQREAAEEAQNLMSVDFATKEEKKLIAEALVGTHFKSPYGKEFQKLLRHGIGLHHAGLLPKYRSLVERLAQKGLLKVISGTDTLGVGVNVPIRTVLFTKLCKYDGEKTALLSVRDFKQISGRAGRRGYDTRGTVVAQAPAHVIENLKLKSKAAADPKKMKKLVLRSPPPQGFVMWTNETFQKLITSKPEPLISRFQISHGMLLNVLGRDGDGCLAMQNLIRASHGDAKSKKHLRKVGFEYFRSLLDRNIIGYVEKNGRQALQVNLDLQDDFSLNQTLSLYLLDTLQVLKPEDPLFSLDLLTLVESVLESPDLILRKQLDRVKTEKMGEMKAAGIEYDQRMEELEKLEFPKPNRDFIYATFNIFAAAHPWVGAENIRPKSIAREMYENFHSFAEYIREYDLQRIEGLLLRYLSEVYKVLEQTVPDAMKTEEVRALVVYFGSMVRQVDSSLLEDWQKLRLASTQLNS